jgi:hypothetical protein|tara:strand:+ start:1180 stop:1344 length:165 start_codon:yes stop_codon:yes gene_type:complete
MRADLFDCDVKALSFLHSLDKEGKAIAELLYQAILWQLSVGLCLESFGFVIFIF